MTWFLWKAYKRRERWKILNCYIKQSKLSIFKASANTVLKKWENMAGRIIKIRIFDKNISVWSQCKPENIVENTGRIILREIQKSTGLAHSLHKPRVPEPCWQNNLKGCTVCQIPWGLGACWLRTHRMWAVLLIVSLLLYQTAGNPSMEMQAAPSRYLWTQSFHLDFKT